MLDLNFIRHNPDRVKKGIAAKQIDPSLVDKVLGVDEKRRQLIKEIENLRARRNKIAKIGEASGEGRKIKENLQKLEPELKGTERDLEELLLEIPNLPLDEVKVGKNEKENVILRQWGPIPKFSFKPLDHLELAEKLDLADFKTGAKVAGSNFYYLKNEAVILEQALILYALNFLVKEGFTPWLTPDLAKEKFYLGTGYLPRGPEAQTYVISGEDLGLVATAEVTLAGIHADEILTEKELPKKYAGFSHCFRVEAGGYGKYSRGLYRVHQFSKVEMFIYCKPGEEKQFHKYLLELEEKIFQRLGIPYRVVEMCTGDLGAQAARKFDLEAWMPGRDDWGEMTSTSNTTDYQARRLNIKYRQKNGVIEFLHTLNGTALATSRALIAILENYQQEDGSVIIPEVLHEYTGFIKIIPKNPRK